MEPGSGIDGYAVMPVWVQESQNICRVEWWIEVYIIRFVLKT